MHKERLCFEHRGNIKRERNKSRWLIALCSVVFAVFAAVAAPIQITEKTNPKIVELYQKLQNKRAEVSGIESKRVDALNENLNAMRENEQRIENRILGATTTLATGMGTMQAATGLAETAADERALADMRAYLSTFMCEFGNGQNVEYGPGDVTLPGGNELMEYYNEYQTLAEDLRKTKVALGLAPGIESEEILERADTGLYDNVAIGKTSGMYASLARGILNPDGDDAAQIAADTQKSAEKLKAGAIAAGAGVVGGIIGNYKINKDAPKESSKQINQEYDAQVSKINQEAAQIETELDAAIAENAAAVREYNAAVESARKNVDEIQRAPTDCQELFGQYITDVSKLELVENETDSVPDITLPEMDSDLLAKCVQCKNKDAMFNAETKTCECPAERPLEQDGKCVEKPVEVAPVVETPVDIETKEELTDEKSEEETDANMCPKTGNALKTITDKHKVGDSCTSDIISQGTITKRKNGTCTCNATGCWSPYIPTKNGKCIKQQSGNASSTAQKKTNEFVDENGYCKEYKTKNWFFNNENTNQVKEYFNKICNDFAKAHNCKRKDLNTGKLLDKEGETGKPGYAFEYEYTCNASSKDYLATQERINQRNANLSYENVCQILEPGKFKQDGNITRKCVGLFDGIFIPDYKTQQELAKGYIGRSAACSEKRETRRNKTTNNPSGYYTNCNSTDDKERYTFIFTGVSNNSTTPENLMRATCSIYGLNYGPTGVDVGRKEPFCKTLDTKKCNEINSFVQKLGYTASIVRGVGCSLDPTGGIAGDNITKTGMKTDEKIKDLRTAFGIDNYMFANISTNMDEWLYDQMRLIIKKEMERAGHSDPLVKFECFPTKSFVLDNRSVLTCQANGRNIDFVFAKLGNVTKRRANASQEGLTCIFGANGKYDGRKCWGLTEQDCKNLNTQIKQKASNCPSCGTEWRDPPGACALTKSTKVEKTDVGLEIAGNVVILAGATVLSIFTEGATVPVLVTSAVETVGAITEAVSASNIRNKADLFLAKTQYCHEAQCAEELLNDDEVRRILNLEHDLNDKQVGVIDDKLSELLGIVSADAPLYVALLNGLADKPNCNFWNKLGAQCEMVQMVNAWSQVAQFASLGYGLGRTAVIRLGKSHKAITKVAQQTAKRMTRAQAKRISEIDKKITTLESKVNRTQKEAAELKQLRQERNTILNKVGTKDADEVAKLSAGAYNPEIEKAQSEYQKLLKEREALAKRMGTDKAPGKVEVQTMDKQIAAAEKKLKDLGADVEPVEPLWGNKNPTGTKPKTDAPEPKPAEPKAEPTATPKAEPGTPTGAPVTPQSRVYEKLGDKVKADIADIKSGKAKELNIPRGQLTDDEWKILKDDLAKDGLEITDGNMYNIVKKSGKADIVPNTSPKPDNSPKPKAPETKPTEPEPAPSPTAPKRTRAQEEAQWRSLYEKYAPENQTFDNFKKSFGNNLDEAEEYAKNWDLNVAETLNFTEARNTSDKLWTDFNNKYGTPGDKYPYGKYADIRAQGISADEYLEIRKKGISTDEYLADKLGWSKEQIEDANKVYMAQQDVKIAQNSELPVGKGDAYSTFDSDIAALRKELQSNLSSAAYDDIEPFFNKGNLTLEEYNNLVDYVSHKKYDEQILIGAFNKEPGLNGVAAKAYDNFLAAKSENVRKISDVAGVSRKSLTGPQVARNKFVQNFVSKRVTLYEDIITKNPNIYNSAKRWDQLSIEEKEKLCKEIFEIADNKLMIQHTDFSVKDLVAMGYQPTTEGVHLNGNVYLSSRHFPDMSFKYVMRKIAHEQAHKVDKLNPNRGILGSQLADLGNKEGYIQGFTGHDYADYRRELTEQSSWLIDEALEEALSKLGF